MTDDPRLKKDSHIHRLKKVFGIVYFSQGMKGLPDLSISYYMINVLKLGPVAGQLFQGLNHLAWFIKPLWGLISDHFPIFGYRRKSYFVIMAFIALFSWSGIGACSYFHLSGVVPYFILVNLAQLAYAFVDVVVDALMVEHGQRLKQVGSFVNFQWLMLGVASVIVALTSGWFQQNVENGKFPYWIIFVATGFFPLFTAVIGVRNLEEEKILKSQASFKGGWSSFKSKVVHGIKSLRSAPAAFADFRKHQRHILLLIVFIIAWNFSPSVGYVSRMYRIQSLQFTPAIFGVLGAVESVTWLLSIFAYRWVVRKFPSISWDRYLYAMIALGILSLLAGYYFYLPPDHPLSFTVPFPWTRILQWACTWKGSFIGNKFYGLLDAASQWNRYHWWALVTDVTLGFASIPAFLIPLTLAGEAATKANAGFIYALLMSVTNFTNAIGDVAGGGLYKLFTASWMQSFMTRFEGSFLNMAGTRTPMVLILQLFVYISALFTFLAIPFVYWIKREFVGKEIEVHLG